MDKLREQYYSAAFSILWPSSKTTIALFKSRPIAFLIVGDKT